MAQKDVGNKIPIYKLKTTDEVMKYYDEWGDRDKYNKDIKYDHIIDITPIQYFQ